MEQVSGAQWRTVQAFGAGHVEIGFIDRGHLDLGRERSQHPVDFLGTLAIAVGMAVHENGLGTKLGRGAQWHGGMHAKLAGFVRRRRNHAALVALSTDDDCLAYQFGIEQLFHGDEEGVHIDVEDRPGESLHGRCDSILPRRPGSGLCPKSINHQGH